MLFAYPFRVFFASAAALAVAVVGVWLGMLLGGWQMPTAFGGSHWHQHEMLFGFLGAAIAGFLLTAVCAWTGTERLHGRWLLGLWIVWLAGRALMFAGGVAPAAVAGAVDLAFLPLVMLDAGRRILQARQHRQLVVLVVLGGLWLTDLGFHLSPAGPFARGALLLAMTLMLVIGGRITPAFSGNWLRMRGRDASRIRTLPALDRLMLATMVLVLAAEMLGWSRGVTGSAALAAAAIAAVRLALWRGWEVREEPLLWILHLALAWIPVALVLRAAAALEWVAPTVWVHAAGTGAMGALILGVMSRVVLGHTGRRMVLPRGMTLALAMILLAGLARVATALGGLPTQAGLALSAVLWITAYGTFLVRYWPMVSSPRVDGKPG